MTASRPLLLCTDLDRTLIPNGEAPESPRARPRFRHLVAQRGVTLAYVTGRHRTLVEEAIADYDLPRPDYVIGDVGTSLYRLVGDEWRPEHRWQDQIGRAWAGAGSAQLAARLAGVEGLRPQEPEKQGPFKLSYYAPVGQEPAALKEAVQAHLLPAGLRANLIWSIDEAAGVGLLDVLPAEASKYHAIDFLMGLIGQDPDTTLFAGDSGNDLEVLASPIPAVLVANAAEEVREEARRLAAEQGHAERLYCARGGWSGMNGHYSAGILEGLAHFRPDLAGLLNG